MNKNQVEPLIFHGRVCSKPIFGPQESPQNHPTRGVPWFAPFSEMQVPHTNLNKHIFKKENSTQV